MVVSLVALTRFLGWRNRRLTGLKQCTKAGNASLTGMATLQQMWERRCGDPTCPAKRRAGGARSHRRRKCQGECPRSAARAALDLTGAESVKANTREAPRGRRSVSRALKMPWRTPSRPNRIPALAILW